MRTSKQLLAVASGLGLVLAGFSSFAQALPDSVVDVDPLEILTPLFVQALGSSPAVTQRAVVEPGVRPEVEKSLPQPSGTGSGREQLDRWVRDFRAAREAFLKQQAELASQAAAEERKLIREAIKETLKQWAEVQREQAKELKEAAKEMKDSLPSVSDIVDSAKTEGRGR
jgi:hypothetical protein